jgi:anti-anti-sigma regulatory factor
LATRFEPIKLTDDSLFGVKLQGAFGRGDRQRLLELAGKCLKNEKTRLIFDCAELDSLGGGGAGVLADLQRQLVELGGEAVFVGPGAVVRKFLTKKFTDLPLRFFPDLAAAQAAFGVDMAPDAAAADGGLDAMLDDYEPEDNEPSDQARRTADLVTAAYVSLDDTLQAANAGGNQALLGEALAVLLDSHDLAAETIYCAPRDDHYVAADGRWRLPADGGIVASLVRTRRPLTMLDIEDNALWDEETQLLEDLQPDLILPLIREGMLTGVAFLQRGGDSREYGLSEVFALELLLRLLSVPLNQPEAAPVVATPRVSVPVPGSGSETMLHVKLELARGLQDAQDLPHFWQVFIARLRLAAEVSSLVFLDTEEPDATPFLAGEARRGLDAEGLRSERITTFFRTLERPVEVANMPASFQEVRDALLGRGAQYLVGLRADDQTFLGMVALGLRWRCRSGEPTDEIHELMEITGEALLRLRENQRRADMSLGLLETLLVGAQEDGQADDPVTYHTAEAVRLLARELGLPPDQERDLVLGALVRNQGLTRDDLDDLVADQLTGQDWETFRAHPDAGDQRMAALNAPAAVRDAVRHHHERFDGRGFPLGLKGRDIPLVARLVAVAQHYALNLARHDADTALQAVQDEAGKGLDPDLVEIFSKAVKRQPGKVTVPA